jgi:hypothetical protein
MTSPEEAVRRLLDSISEPLDLDPDKLARVFITPSRHRVYPLQVK